VLDPRIVILCPLAEEWSILSSAFEPSQGVKRVEGLKISAVSVGDWRALMATGGRGKTQFAVQAQYLIGLYPSVELVICAGAAGSLVPELSTDDVVIETETVEHDYRLLFATRPLPLGPDLQSAQRSSSHSRRAYAALPRVPRLACTAGGR
jgi:adenosylhomocysteine nucleosidase